MTPCVQPAGRQTGGAQAGGATIPGALITHMTLAWMLYLIHLNKKKKKKEKGERGLFFFGTYLLQHLQMQSTQTNGL